MPPQTVLTPNILPQIRRRILAWYEGNRRDLPWRRTRDPYAVWIAETMLQQTRVKTAIPYYGRFLGAFPTLEALDRASKRKVLAVWSGLGYYRRAENLKRSARRIVLEHGGTIPRDFDALRALPGIGAYTAGAIMSIAFDRPYPALDGNARRFLMRLLDIKQEKQLREAATMLLPASRAGRFNQALMEIGSTICRARGPACGLCPVSEWCAARSAGRYDLGRLAMPKRRSREVEWPLLVIRDGNRMLFRRRPEGGLLGGLWEIPGGERKRGESVEAALARHLGGLAQGVGPRSYVGEIRHGITYRRIRAPVFIRADYGERPSPDSSWRWLSLSNLDRYPLSSLSLKAVRLIEKHSHSVHGRASSPARNNEGPSG